MRRILRILKWLGVGLSALLFAGTLILWGRGVGHEEKWELDRCEPEPRWTTEPLAGTGTRRRCSASAGGGRLWLSWSTQSPFPRFKSKTWHGRRPITAESAKWLFETTFHSPPFSTPNGSIHRTWNWAGVSFGYERGPVDPELGRPRYEDFELAIPFRLLAVLFGAWPTAVLTRRLLKKRRDAPGLCPQCGYDLRATPDARGPRLARCPECGRETAEEAKVA